MDYQGVVIGAGDLGQRLAAVRVAGGLPLPLAVPLALTLTASVMAVTITVAGSWMS